MPQHMAQDMVQGIAQDMEQGMAMAQMSMPAEQAKTAALVAAEGARGYLQARNVSIAYAGRGGEIVLAIDQIDLSVARGEFVCLLGPSGCGKTTFLNAVAGFLPVSAGELT